MHDNTYRRPIAWTASAVTHAGMVRELNEDSVMTQSDQGHWALADGMGGHQVGDMASQTIVDALDRLNLPETLGSVVDTIEDRVVAVNRELQDYAERQLGGATVGSTLVDLVIRGRVGVCLWAGDSRLYRYRRHRLEQLTQDHSQVSEMVEMGLLTQEEARAHKSSNVITRAVGVEEPLYLDGRLFDAQMGDIYLLCSDGLHNVLSNEDITSIISCRDPQKSVDRLLDTALQAGGPDNVSAIVIKGEPGRVPANSPEGTSAQLDA